MDLAAVLKLVGKLNPDLKKRELEFTLGPIKCTIPLERARWFIDDPRILEDIIADCLINRRIMTASMQAETVELVDSSLNDLISYVAAKKKLVTSRLPGDVLLSTLLTAWRSAAITASQSIKDARRTEERDRDDWRRGELLDSEEIAAAREVLPEILCTFRKSAFGYAYAIITMMPEGNPVRSEAERAYSNGFRVGLEECRFDIRTIPEPEWSIAD